MNPKSPTSGGGRRDQPGDYEVGYARPPLSTQFKTGGVGNPKGRPKKKRTVGQMIEDALMARVTLEENGKRKTMTAQEVIIKNLVHAAARRDMKAVQAIFSLRDRYQDRPNTTLEIEELETNDRAIIEEYLRNVSGTNVEPTCPAADQSARDDAESHTADGASDAAED
jgi:hypothetical protein